MQFKHIKIDKCPVCGDRATLDEWRGQHTNGEDFEKRNFACGLSVEHMPNFRYTRVNYFCPQDPQVKLAQTEAEQRWERLRRLVEKLYPDDKMHTQIMREVIRSTQPTLIPAEVTLLVQEVGNSWVIKPYKEVYDERNRTRSRQTRIPEQVY